MWQKERGMVAEASAKASKGKSAGTASVVSSAAVAVVTPGARANRRESQMLSESEVRALTTMTIERVGVSVHGQTQAHALRAKIVLACGEGLDNKAIGLKLNVSARTVAKWRARFMTDRLAGLEDAPRSGAPKSVDHIAVASFIDKARRVNPHALNARSIAREANVSVSTVTRMLRTTRASPDSAAVDRASVDRVSIDSPKRTSDLAERHPSVDAARVSIPSLRASQEDAARVKPDPATGVSRPIVEGAAERTLDEDLKLAFYMAPVGLLVARQRVIEAYNETFCGMFGYDSDALAGKSLEFLYPSRDEFQHIGSRAMVTMRDTGLYSDERIMRRVDESLFWCHVSGRTMNREDPLAAAVWCFEDISSVRRVATNLTSREREVAQLLVIGKSSKQIGRELKISFRTVEAHRARLMRKYGVASISGLIAFLVGRHEDGNRPIEAASARSIPM
jgi:PAS domain S-box-containing protein